MKGLRIQTISGKVLEVKGTVTFNPATNTYYCAGESWPGEIVKEVLQ